MPYLILAIALVVGIVLLARGVSGTDPKVLLRTFKWAGAVIAVALIAYLTVTGRLGIAAGIAAFALPLLLRARQIARMARSFRGPQPGQTSDVETAYLRMQLDHDTGALNGTVLEGRFRGRRLDELGLEQLGELLRECRVNDEKSASILETYLDRVHGSAWREADEAPGGARAGQGAAPGAQGLSKDEAYEILGLSPGASAEEIHEAHRRLMLKIHPDQGGSTYLAAKINQAKDTLLGR